MADDLTERVARASDDLPMTPEREAILAQCIMRPPRPIAFPTADPLTERVSKAIHKTRWTGRTSTPSRDIARVALAVVADDVDGLAGVLRAHQGVGRDVAASEWYCTTCDADIPGRINEYPEVVLIRHQAAMLAAYIRDGAS